MRITVQIISESMNGHDNAMDGIGLVKSDPHYIADSFVHNRTEVFEQVVVVTKVGLQHPGNGEAKHFCQTPHCMRLPAHEFLCLIRMH